MTKSEASISAIKDSNPGHASTSKNSRRRKTARALRRRNMATVELFDEFSEFVSFDRFELSIVGVYLHSELVMYPGDELKLRITFNHDDNPLIVKGKVVSAELDNVGRGPGMGIAFRSLGPRDKLALKQFFARRFLYHD